MKRTGVLLVAILVLAGCTRVVDANPVAQRSVAPISESQVRDLLSRDAQGHAVVDVGVYTSIEPPRCAGLVQEANSPLIFDAKPAVNDGGYWSNGQVGVIEFAAVYRTDYKPEDVLGRVRSMADSCQGETLISAGDDGTPPDNFRVLPPVDSGSPDIAVWSVVDRSGGWTCDNAFAAAYNAAVYITACGVAGGFDTLTLAEGALDRINKLANTVA